MSWLTNTVWANLRPGRKLSTCLASILCMGGLSGGEVAGVHVPASVVAGTPTPISTAGSGKAAFYLIGPSISVKRDVNLGEAVQLQSRDVQNAGRYVAVVCSESCQSAAFYVTAAKPASMSFLVHPSRVPVAQSDAVSGVVLPFDQFRNLVLEPLTVDFQLTAGTAALMSRPIQTHNGVAWFRTSSGKTAGTLQVAASINELAAKRVVRQVASDPCNLRIKGQRTTKGILVETELVHDCAGNPVTDGTIVTFTASEANGKSTVDAPIKQGVARAQIASPGPVVVSVASGVVMGNELRVGGHP